VSAPPYSPAPLDTLEAARDLQDRLGRFAAALFVISAVMGVASIGSHVATQGQASESGGLLHELVHVAALVPALGVWLRCRGKDLSTAVLEASTRASRSASACSSRCSG
jgi:hypothetical protein